ncbi:MAG: hypothetical protein JO115_01520 [Pseudonocardiales bacterium]|nr:hypothetical protein [Pseudonocardiales bacterium]
MTATEVVPAAHRLVLSADEYQYLIELARVDMPPGWEPKVAEHSASVRSELAKRGVLQRHDGRFTVHPSVLINLRTLTTPMIIVDTTVSIGNRESRSLHTLAGQLGASLFALEDGAVELSMFAAVNLGQELIRAVPAEPDSGISSVLGGSADREPLPSGRVPLGALHELGLAALLAGADPDAPRAVLEGLDLPADQAYLARHVSRSDGVLRSLVTARTPSGVTSSVVLWLHLESRWLGILPDPDGSGRHLVRLEPVSRTDLGTWVAPFIAGVLS